MAPLWTGDRSKAEMHIGSTAIRVDGQTSVSFLRSQSARYVSPELTYEDLDQNGTWRTDVTTVRSGSRRDPWGWTWVDDAPYGFVTSHYGRWAYLNGGYGVGGSPDVQYVRPEHPMSSQRLDAAKG